MITLTSFVEELITKYNFTDTEENIKKLRIKITRELKKRGYWFSAEQRKIGKSITRVFRQIDLTEVELAIEPYLIKKGGLSKEQIEEYRAVNLNHLEYWRDMTNEKYEVEIANAPDRVSRQEQINLMIEALFYEKFKGINLQLWQEDSDYMHYADVYDEDEVTSIEYIQRQHRLTNKLESYVIKKED